MTIRFKPNWSKLTSWWSPTYLKDMYLKGNIPHKNKGKGWKTIWFALTSVWMSTSEILQSFKKMWQLPRNKHVLKRWNYHLVIENVPEKWSFSPSHCRSAASQASLSKGPSLFFTVWNNLPPGSRRNNPMASKPPSSFLCFFKKKTKELLELILKIVHQVQGLFHVGIHDKSNLQTKSGSCIFQWIMTVIHFQSFLSWWHAEFERPQYGAFPQLSRSKFPWTKGFSAKAPSIHRPRIPYAHRVGVGKNHKL